MAKDDYFVIAYKILRTLKAAMRVEEFDAEQISAEILHINGGYWESIILMLFQEGYITGVTAIPDVVKTRFNEVNTELKQAKDALKERDSQLETLKKSTGDVEAEKRFGFQSSDRIDAIPSPGRFPRQGDQGYISTVQCFTESGRAAGND
jgi:hypothetical protein